MTRKDRDAFEWGIFFVVVGAIFALLYAARACYLFDFLPRQVALEGATEEATYLPLAVRAAPKRGVTWAGSPIEQTTRFVEMGVDAVHHWNYLESRITPIQDLGIEYVAHQWGCGTSDRSWDKVDLNALRYFALEYTGLTWLVFNEPDNPDQADCHPSVAADVYYDVYHAIRGADPTAKVYCCGTSRWPAHWKWTAAFMQAYMDKYTRNGECPPMDGYHIHNYGDFANRFDFVAHQSNLLGFVETANEGFWGCYPGGLSTIISEWGVLSDVVDSPNEVQLVAEYLQAMWPWLEAQPWIEQHFWYSTYTEGMSSNLFAGLHSGELTIVGDAWMDMAHGTPAPTATPAPTSTTTPTRTPTPHVTVTATPEHVQIIFEDCTYDCECWREP